MWWNYVSITIMCYLISSIVTGHEYGHIYRDLCQATRAESNGEIHNKNKTNVQCNIENIPEHELILIDDDRLEVKLNLPDIPCTYDLILLANETVDEEECEKHDFTNFRSSEIHTLNKLHVRKLNATHIRQENGNCTSQDTVVYYEYIFSGCYALGFTLHGFDHTYRAKKYIKTSYKRIDITTLEANCTFHMSEEDSSDVEFDFKISLDSRFPLELEMRSKFHADDTSAQPCGSSSRAMANATWKANLRNPDPETRLMQHCNPMLIHGNLAGNQSYMKCFECQVSLPVSFNESYCLKVTSYDTRCRSQTLWKPPPVTLNSACTWLIPCRRELKGSKIVDLDNRELENNRGNHGLLIPLVLGILTLFFILTGIMLYIQRWRSNNERIYSSANLKDLRLANHQESDNIDTDDEIRKDGKEMENGESKGIILLYARDSVRFMAFMTEFREILKIHCKCHIYDWYAASEWNDVAKVGACEWVTNLFKKQYRTIWIDTPSARSLLSMHPNDDKLNEQVVSDFRDMAFGAVLDYAKRTISNIKLQYSSHFIVRLEGFDNSNSPEDPFSDLSPHARYLIPYHLSQLCSHLSWKKSANHSNSLVTEESQLRKSLVQMKNNSS